MRFALLFSIALGACDGGMPPAPDGGPADAGTDAAPDLRTPADTYFAMAVADDSHNHTGDRLLFLDFADRDDGSFDTTDRGNRVVQAPFVTSAIAIDADASDWSSIPSTTVRGVPQNNYVLDVHYDAVPIPIELSAAYDEDFLYVLVRWEDPGHARSDRYRMWTYDETAATWTRAGVAPIVAGAPNENVVNHDVALTGVEDEDRAMFMFPLDDSESFFADGGLGCAGMCHANLREADPAMPIGSRGVMNAGLAQARMDLWAWTASRSAPSGHADDGLVVAAADVFQNGRQFDSGDASFIDNGDTAPMFRDPAGFSQGSVLAQADAVAIAPADVPADGDTIPAVLIQTPSGSRADVESAQAYDDATFTWTLELRRRLDTGNGDDHQFVPGPAAHPPASVMRIAPDPRVGGPLFTGVCARCHGSQAQGMPGTGMWMYPRIQRASASLVAAALTRVPDMAGLPVTDDDIENIQAFLAVLRTP